MTQLILVVMIAIGLLAVVALLVRGAFSNGGNKLLVEPAPIAGPTDIPPSLLMGRIFAEDDLSFVSGEGVADIRKQFLRDRRRIALSWLSQTRREATRILGFHLRAVRTSVSLDPEVELQLLAHTLLFFAVYTLLWTIVATYGAFRARGFVWNAVNLAGRLSTLGSRILADAGRSGPALAQSHGHA